MRFGPAYPYHDNAANNCQQLQDGASMTFNKFSASRPIPSKDKLNDKKQPTAVHSPEQFVEIHNKASKPIQKS